MITLYHPWDWYGKIKQEQTTNHENAIQQSVSQEATKAQCGHRGSPQPGASRSQCVFFLDGANWLSPGQHTLRLTCGPAGNRTATGSLSGRPTNYSTWTPTSRSQSAICAGNILTDYFDTIQKPAMTLPCGKRKV